MADLLSDDGFAAATRQGDRERATLPLPLAVRFDAPSGRVVIEFANGSTFTVPARALEDLQEASDADLAAVELAGETALHWERLDVDFSIAGLMQGVFGTVAFMKAREEHGRAA